MAMNKLIMLAATICVSTTALPTYADGNIDDFYFRYDFSGGQKVYESKGDIPDPASLDSGCIAVSGTNDYGTAAHPWGYGTIPNNALNDDWTLAMSFKSCTREKGTIVCLGNNTNGYKELAVCSSSTPGVLHFAVIQGTANGTRSVPKSWDVSGLGDTTNAFHSLVLVHNKGIGGNATGLVTVYWDGCQIATLDSAENSAACPFWDGFQFCTLFGGFSTYLSRLGYSNESYNPEIAFQDTRFFTRALSAQEVALYAERYPAASVFVDSIENFYWRFNFTNGEKVYEHNGCPDEPAQYGASCAKVPGPNGYGTAGHPSGYTEPSSTDYSVSTNDWTIAMSFRSCSIEKGVLLCFGDNRNIDSKQMVVCSSSTSGKLNLGIIKRTSSGKSVVTSKDLTNLGDVTNMFHTLVAAYTHSDELVRLYWDGVPLTINWNTQVANVKFSDGLQFFSTLGGNLSGYSAVNCPDAAFEDVRFITNAWTTAEARLYAAQFPPRTASIADIDAFHFRHNFSTGQLVIEGAGYGDTPMAMSGKGTAVDGPDGVGTATFPEYYAWGTAISGGLACDWTLAMSFKATSDINKGVMVAVGGTWSKDTKGLAIATSTTPGALFISNPQNYGTGKNYADNKVLSGLGNVSNYFHTLVVSYSNNLKLDKYIDQAWKSGTFFFYWDGRYVGNMTTCNSYSRPIANGMQYGSVYGGNPSSLAGLTDVSCDVRFQDVRFFTNIWTSAEAALYARRYPVRRPSLQNTTTWTDAQGDEIFDNGANWSWGQVPESDQGTILSSATDVSVTVTNAYVLGALRVEGGGAITLDGTGAISATNVTVAANTAFDPGGVMAFPSLVLESGAAFTSTSTGISVARLTSNGGVLKPSGTDYIAVTDSITGTLYADRHGTNGSLDRVVPLVKVPVALEAAADAALAVRSGGRLRKEIRDGFVYYDLSPSGVVIILK